MINTGAVFTVTFVIWSLVRFEDMRRHALEAVQDGDKVTHWSDGKNVVSLVLGLFSAWFTCNMTLALVATDRIDAEHIALVTIFVAVTFTLLGIAWKRNH